MNMLILLVLIINISCTTTKNEESIGQNTGTDVIDESASEETNTQEQTIKLGNYMCYLSKEIENSSLVTYSQPWSPDELSSEKEDFNSFMVNGMEDISLSASNNGINEQNLLNGHENSHVDSDNRDQNYSRSEPSEATTSENTQLYTVNISHLNVRSNPGMSSEIIGILQAGDTVRGYPINKTWLKVATNKYVSLHFLRKTVP
ncbi:MAG: hypothetical protein CMP10_02220 [Zetaproteobacteria bacterium]|nr:hypothetical protein [Pseudobdellovibrionaceae bacterium]